MTIVPFICSEGMQCHSLHYILLKQIKRVLFVIHILASKYERNWYYSRWRRLIVMLGAGSVDILPLRVVPPLLFGGSVYGLVGLVPTVACSGNCLLPCPF